MRNTYNANMYLTTADLVDVENKIYDITNSIQQQVFSNNQSTLRNINVNDSLSGKILYLSFPRTSYSRINNTTTTDIIKVDDNNKISYVKENNNSVIVILYKGKKYYVYSKNTNDSNPNINVVNVKLPMDFGVVSSVLSNNYFYNYIKIQNKETTIPNYVKNTYGQLPTMKQIDNIEKGIENIGYYLYRPLGWQGNREFLGTMVIGDNNFNNGITTKNISYIDFNRWINMLNMIDLSAASDINIWNSVSHSHLNWNETSSFDWEEF